MGQWPDQMVRKVSESLPSPIFPTGTVAPILHFVGTLTTVYPFMCEIIEKE
jgi:hypothetical protein